MNKQVFISQDEFKQLVDAKDEVLLNEILSRVFNKAVETAICSMPDIITRLIKSISATQKMSADFFDANKEFKNHLDIVTAAIQEVEAAHSDWNYDRILTESVPIIKQKVAMLDKVALVEVPIERDKISIIQTANGVLSEVL